LGKIASGLANNNVEQITDYSGSTGTATLATNLTSTTVPLIDTFNLWKCIRWILL
jgi:predicted double-glycine peptidase